MEQITPRLMSWASIIEPDTLDQARATSNMPFVFPHVALMPDAHLGKGATVGSVIATLGAIMPAAVGVDIGCGMVALRTGYTVDELHARGSLTPLREAIENAIPLSAGRYNQTITPTAEIKIADLRALAEGLGVDPSRYAANWREQLGSLGSGNHFIEISADESDRVWIFLHSGSRGVGNKIAQHHIKVARELMEMYWISLPDPDLAYLVQGTPEFNAYINDLMWAQEFARQNRDEMLHRTGVALASFMGDTALVSDIGVNCHHNYTQREVHWGKGVWVSRKGAISAREGELGLIPGSMGDKSYVVEGKGNRLALHSAPHGAGRVLSRSKAKKTFTEESLAEKMRGIEWSGSAEFLDEHPDAYKDIDTVMRDAADLVTIRHTLRQLVNVKGD